MKRFTIALLVAALIGSNSGFTTTARAGRLPGSASHPDRVQALTSDVYHMTFRGNEVARILVDGDHTTDLDLIVCDELGNVVASDMDLTDTCLVEWTPRWTGSFTVKVINRGGIYNDYVLLTN